MGRVAARILRDNQLPVQVLKNEMGGMLWAVVMPYYCVTLPCARHTIGAIQVMRSYRARCPVPTGKQGQGEKQADPDEKRPVQAAARGWLALVNNQLSVAHLVD